MGEPGMEPEAVPVPVEAVAVPAVPRPWKKTRPDPLDMHRRKVAEQKAEREREQRQVQEAEVPVQTACASVETAAGEAAQTEYRVSWVDPLAAARAERKSQRRRVSFSQTEQVMVFESDSRSGNAGSKMSYRNGHCTWKKSFEHD